LTHIKGEASENWQLISEWMVTEGNGSSNLREGRVEVIEAVKVEHKGQDQSAKK